MSRYLSKDRGVRQRQMEIQEVSVQVDDTHIYDANGGNGKFDLGEDVEKVMAILVVDDSLGTVAPIQAANIAISGTEVTCTGLALAADDTAIVRYKVAE